VLVKFTKNKFKKRDSQLSYTEKMTLLPQQNVLSNPQQTRVVEVTILLVTVTTVIVVVTNHIVVVTIEIVTTILVC